jgi:cytochrome c-type biogenesis protein CcmH
VNPAMPLRSVALVLVLILLALALGAADTAGAFSGDTEVRNIAKKLQCPVCQGTSVADSQSPVAEGMRESIREKLAEGATEQEILDFFVARYNAGVLRDPPANGWFSAIYWVPALVLVAGLSLILLTVRRRRGEAQLTTADGPPLDMNDEELDRYRRRLREEVEDSEL